MKTTQRTHRDLALHAIHGRQRAIHINFGLLLQPVERLFRRRNLLVHDANLSPHLTHLGFDLRTQIGQRAVVIVQNGGVDVVKAGVQC
jgi:hypothetical protein